MAEKIPLTIACILLAIWSTLLQLYGAPAKLWLAGQWQQWHTDTTSHEDLTAVPQCLPPAYTTRIIMHDPFVMHIENFITPEERAYLLEFGKPFLEPSKVTFTNGTESLDPQRTSSTAFLGRTDPVVACILARAADLQGFLPLSSLEDLQITAYNASQQYRPHYDWFAEHLVPSMDGTNRASTFFVTLEADCEGCGTQFPRLRVDWGGRDERWCGFVECAETERLTVKAVPGSAVFWRNLRSDGFGDPRTLHAGLPVPEGRKVGVNIWTREVAPGL